MKKHILSTIISVTALTALTACSEKVYDVEYYLQHVEERKAKIEQCKNNPGEMANNPNCKNAAAALNRAMFHGTEMPRIR
jgi:hypothetical protein